MFNTSDTVVVCLQALMASPSVKQTGPSDSVNSVITRDGLYPHVLGYAGKEAEKGRGRVDSRGAEVEELSNEPMRPVLRRR